MKLWVVAVLALLGCTGAFAQSSKLINEINGNAASPYVGYNLQVTALKQLLLDMVTTFSGTTVYGADPTGATDSSAAINNALSATASTGGNVLLPPGTYMVTSGIVMQPNVSLICQSGATIIQGPSANLTIIIDFSSAAANGASLQNCIIDGNRSNNTDNVNVFCIFGGASSNILIQFNTIQNCNGYGIDLQAATGARILNNKVTNFFVIGIAQISHVVNFGSFARIEGNILLTPMGQHAIGVVNADYARIWGNHIYAPITEYTVNTSGMTITYITGGSGSFAGIKPGMFAVLNGGQEFLILTVSATSITVNLTLPTLSSIPATMGTGDLLIVDSSSYADVGDNWLDGGVTQGIGLSTGTGGESAQKNLVHNNIVLRTGEMCIGVQQISTTMFDNSIVGNQLSDCGQSIDATSGGSGVLVSAIGIISSGGVTGTYIGDNFIKDDAATISYWLYLVGGTINTAYLGQNSYKGVGNTGVFGDISSITLTNFGSGASTSNIVSQGNAVQFQITVGTGPSNQPDFVVNKNISMQGNAPVIQCKQVAGSNLPVPLYGEQNSTSTQWIAFINDTTSGGLIAGNNYIVNCKG